MNAKYLRLMIAATAALFISASCSEKEEAGDGQASDARLRKDAYEWNEQQAVIETVGAGRVTFSVTISGDWCSLAQGSLQSSASNLSAGSRVTIYMKPNMTTADRRTSIGIVFSDGESRVLTLLQRCESPSDDPQEPDDPQDPENPDDPDEPEWVAHSWGELPEYVRNDDYIHKTYYAAMSDNSTVRNYSVCFDKSRKVSRWVAYPMHEAYMTYSDYPAEKSGGRTNAWAFDDAVTEYSSVRLPGSYGYYTILSRYDEAADAYDTATKPVIRHGWQQNVPEGAYNDRPENTSLGLARGHMLPSASRVNSFAVNAQTFYATNMMPQVQAFNESSWSKVEDYTRKSTCPDTLYVVVGTLYESGSYTINARNRENIGVPSHCYKLLLRTKSGTTGRSIGEIKSADELICIGFLFRNSSDDKSKTPSAAAVSVAEIEQRTGFRFFCNIDPSIAQSVKSQKNIGDWPAFR